MIAILSKSSFDDGHCHFDYKQKFLKKNTDVDVCTTGYQNCHYIPTTLWAKFSNHDGLEPVLDSIWC
jgi:hypothetical protein